MNTFLQKNITYVKRFKSIILLLMCYLLWLATTVILLTKVFYG